MYSHIVIYFIIPFVCLITGCSHNITGKAAEHNIMIRGHNNNYYKCSFITLWEGDIMGGGCLVA